MENISLRLLPQQILHSIRRCGCRPPLAHKTISIFILQSLANMRGGGRHQEGYLFFSKKSGLGRPIDSQSSRIRDWISEAIRLFFNPLRTSDPYFLVKKGEKRYRKANGG